MDSDCMKPSPSRLLLKASPLLITTAALMWNAQVKAAEAPVSFYKEVRPVFEAACHGCHQPAKAKGDYVMTDFAKLIAGVDNNPAVVPGAPDAAT